MVTGKAHGVTQENKRGLNLELKNIKRLIHCKSKKIEWFASAWDTESQIF